MSVINTNIRSLVVQNAMKVNNRNMSDTMEQLSTGRRINSASDDAAGLAISENMTAQIRGLNMAVRNANDGISMAQTAEGALIEISNMLQRMRELSVQAGNGTLSEEQRNYLSAEFKALAAQIDNTLTNTKWNGIAVLGSAVMTSTSTGGIVIQVGSEAGSAMTINVRGDLLSSALSAGVFSGGIGGSSTTTATSMIADVDRALEQVNKARANLGAVVNRLTSASDNLANIAQNLTESRSRVLDTDYAMATTELARTQIIQQASTAVLAQANTQPQSVLKLLQG
jgi:flagellin